VPRTKKNFVFYVDTECSFSTRNRCSYYSSPQVQEEAGDSAKEAWGSKCCPMVWAKTGPKKFAAFCPTRGGPFGEQLPMLGGGPGSDAIRVEVQAFGTEPWAEIVEKAAKIACETQC